MIDYSSKNNNDPANYATFDDFAAGSSMSFTVGEMANRWNKANPSDYVCAFGDPNVLQPRSYVGAFDRSSKFTRAMAAIQLVGGGIELFIGGGALVAPEPTGITKVVGVVLLTHAVDTLQAALRTIVMGDRTATLTETGTSSIAKWAGASPHTAQTIGVVTDVGIGVSGTFAVGVLSRMAPRAGQLVHLTTAENAAAIKASQTFGLGNSTLYAGPETLAKAKGWSIVARTGVLPKHATDVILLPSRARQAFLIVKPIGPFSAWQRINGTVFSASAGSLNLTTGAFTRSGPAINQMAMYGIDSIMMATTRSEASMASVPRK